MMTSSSRLRPCLLAHLIVASSLALACPAQAGATLGRLFLTPDERVTLERLRHAPQVATVVGPKTGAVAVSVEPVRLEGYVERDGGHSSAWFNGTVVHDGARANGLQAEAAALPEVEVRLVDGSAVRLRVGQTYDPASSTIIEAWQRERTAPAVHGEGEK